MSVWQEYNPSPVKARVGDCAVRALACALDISWDEAYIKLTVQGFNMCDMPSSNSVVNAVLKGSGFTRESIPNTCPNCYSFKDFCDDHPTGVYILGTGNHLACVKDGILMDAWNSEEEIPLYYWSREEESRKE